MPYICVGKTVWEKFVLWLAESVCHYPLFFCTGTACLYGLNVVGRVSLLYLPLRGGGGFSGVLQGALVIKNGELTRKQVGGLGEIQFEIGCKITKKGDSFGICYA